MTLVPFVMAIKLLSGEKIVLVTFEITSEKSITWPNNVYFQIFK
jgi:hypothetical protein